MFYKVYRHPERPFVLHICIGHDSAFLEKKFNRRKHKLLSVEKNFFVEEDSIEMVTYDMADYVHGHFVIKVRDMNFKFEDIAHEAMHCTAMHFRYIGSKLDESSEESYAYMLGWIVGLFEKIRKKHDKTYGKPKENCP